MYEERPIRVAAASLRGWISRGSTPTVAWISDAGSQSSFRWSSALVIAGVGLMGVVVARRLLPGGESKDQGGGDLEGGGSQAAKQGQAQKQPGRGLDDSFEGIDEEDWDAVRAPSDMPKNPLEASAVMLPSKAAASLEKSVVMVGHPDREGPDAKAKGGSGGWLGKLNPFS